MSLFDFLFLFIKLDLKNKKTNFLNNYLENLLLLHNLYSSLFNCKICFIALDPFTLGSRDKLNQDRVDHASLGVTQPGNDTGDSWNLFCEWKAWEGRSVMVCVSERQNELWEKEKKREGEEKRGGEKRRGQRCPIWHSATAVSVILLTHMTAVFIRSRIYKWRSIAPSYVAHN